MPGGNEGDDYEPLVDRQREAPDGLTRQQVNQVLMTVEDTHPLRELAKAHHIVPQFKMCLKRNNNENFKFALRQSLMQEMNMKVPKSEAELIENPFLVLGFGINSYFDMMLHLSKMFFFSTLFFIPVFLWFKRNNEGYLASESKNPMKQLQAFTLGNIGGATTICQQTKLLAESMTFECPAGLDIDYKNIVYGLISSDNIVNYYCHEKPIFQADTSYTKCTKYMDFAYIHDQIANCQKAFMADPENKSACKIQFDNRSKLLRTVTSTEDQKAIETCGDDATVLYLQSPCIVREFQIPVPQKGEKYKFPNLYKRQIYGLMVGCLGVFVYLFSTIYLDYLKQVQKNNFLDFDIKTITAGDYSIEFDLDHRIYEKWKSTYYMENNPISEMAQFKIYIQNILEERISAMNDLGYDGPCENPDEKKIKIAQITFAFHNEKIINLLKKRGVFIRTEKWDKLDDINDKIDDSLKDEALLNKLQTPCSVFATFETEEGVNRALQLNKQIKQKILPKSFGKICQQEIEIQSASEPSDIIWENRSFTEYQRNFKRGVSYTIILILLAISGTVIYYCSSTSTSLKTRYPATNCLADAKQFNIPYKSVDQAYLDQHPGSSHYADMVSEAVKEYLANEAIKEQRANGNKNDKLHYTTVLKCFCTFELANKVPLTQTYETGDSGKHAICAAYQKDVSNGKLLGIMITIVIILFNQILRRSTIALLTWVGEDTYSARLASITNGVFVAQFFNTGLLLILVNANLKEHLPPFLAVYFQGTYYDYSPDWYSEVGSKIVQTMFIQAVIIPWVGLTTASLIPRIKKKLDNGNPYKTKKTSMAALRILYSGGDYIIHFKYSGMLTVAFITMMYGMGMPALFPIAALNLWNQYVAERVVVAYHMKAPAALDDQLTVNCINKLRFAPTLFLLNGAWMLGNTQMFTNTWSYIDDSARSMRSDHLMAWHLDWVTPQILFGLLAIGLYVIQKVAGDKLAEWGFQMADCEIAVDEDLPNFFKSVKLSQADELIAENTNMMENFGFEPNDPDTITILDSTVVPKKAIQGTPWYQILSNFNYANEFNYIGAFVNEREKLIEDGYPEVFEDGDQSKGMTLACKKARFEQSDMVVILLNISYVPDDVARKINFKPGWQKEFKQNMEEFKKQFYQKYERNWEFQNSRLEDDYIDFFRNAQLRDVDYIKEKTAEQFESKFAVFWQRIKTEKTGNAIN